VFEVESVSDPKVDDWICRIWLSRRASMWARCREWRPTTSSPSGLRPESSVQGRVGGRPAVLRATCYRKYGLVGHSGADEDHAGETPDEMEYFCARSLAYDAPISFQGVDVDGHPGNARQDEYLEMFGRYERLRLARYFF